MIVEKLRAYDCRFCSNYQHDRENSEVQAFKCLEGYFDFVEKGDGTIVGNHEDSPPLCREDQLPCHGENFEYSPGLEWVALAEKYRVA